MDGGPKGYEFVRGGRKVPGCWLSDWLKTLENQENTVKAKENVTKLYQVKMVPFHCNFFCRKSVISVNVCIVFQIVLLSHINIHYLSFQPSKPAAALSKPGTQQRDRSISSVSVHSSGRPKSSLSTLTDKGSPEPAIEEIIEEPSVLEQEIQYEEQIRLDWNFFVSGTRSIALGNRYSASHDVRE